MAAYLTWTLSTNPTEKVSKQAMELGEARNKWKNKVCESQIKSDWLTAEQNRKLYLLCRGPRFTEGLTR